MFRFPASFMIALLLFGCLLVTACSGDDDDQTPSGDGDVDGDDSDDDDDTPDGDAEDTADGDGETGEDVEAEPVTRRLIDGTTGWCETTGDVSVACRTASDCRAYRIPVPTDCDGESAEPLFDCALAEVGAFPSQYDSECTADSRCDAVPRTCMDGVCRIHLPDDTCEQDTDCAFNDAGCFCFPHRADVTDFDPGYGDACQHQTACPANAQAKCVYGTCRVVGSHLDAEIAAFCGTMFEWGIELFGDQATCQTNLAAEEYKGAAALATTMQAAQDATSLSGFIAGPWKDFYRCVTSK